MSYQDWDYTAWVRVHDPEQLLAAALAHPDAVEAGDTRDDFIDADGQVDVNACLIMLLDNNVPGCEILSSGAHAGEGA